MIFIAGATLAFFLGCLLLVKRKRAFPDTMLCIWMFALMLHLLLFHAHYSGLDQKYPHLLGIGIPFPLLHGPMLYLYTSALTGYLRRWKWTTSLHFVPVVLFYIRYAEFFISGADEKMAFVKRMVIEPDGFIRLLFPAIVLSGFAYMLMTLLMLRRHSRNLLNSYANPGERVNLHWLRNLLIGLLLIWIVVSFGDFVFDTSMKDPSIYTVATLFVGYIGFWGLRQGNIFVQTEGERQGEDDRENEGERDRKRYTKSGLKQDQSIRLQQQLLEWMEVQKLFLDEEISLPLLADKAEIHPNYLSQVINEKFGKNFYDFVNAYRVEEFKRLVREGQHKNKTLFALALDSGFSSKATFNNCFKKHTGITPTEFIKSV